ncbi:MAG: hypothetical protein FJ088_01945, partial [Deltaproteobacteria bacterium]|nr:hypothetical protein [Deltaproteobacteria bacterium]
MRACKYLSVFVVILTFSCAAKKDRRDIKEIPEPTVEVREKTAYESQIEKLEGFFAEYENCESYINAVDPSLILRGELPVNVVEMDKVCKPFVSDFRAFDDNFLGALMEYDYTVISLAEAVDDYLILSFKSKRVGVKDRKALKAEIELAKSKSGSSLKAARDGFAALKALGLRDFPEKSYIAGMFGA